MMNKIDAYYTNIKLVKREILKFSDGSKMKVIYINADKSEKEYNKLLKQGFRKE